MASLFFSRYSAPFFEDLVFFVLVTCAKPLLPLILSHGGAVALPITAKSVKPNSFFGLDPLRRADFGFYRYHSQAQPRSFVCKVFCSVSDSVLRFSHDSKESSKEKAKSSQRRHRVRRRTLCDTKDKQFVRSAF